MNLRHFNRIVRQVLLFPVIALALVAAALSWQIASSTGTVKLIQDSDESIAQTNLVGRQIIDEESGLRGFQTTGDKQFLAPYNQALGTLPPSFDRLEALRLNASELQLIRQLRSDHDIWLESFAKPIIATTAARGRVEADTGDIALNLHGKQLMDKVRSDLQAVVMADEAHRARRVDRWRTQVRDMVLGLIGFAVVIGIFIGLFTRNRLHVVSDAYRHWVETLRHKNEELFLSEQQLRTTLASIGDGVITCDIDGRIQMLNQVASEITGWKTEDALSRPLSTVFQVLDGSTREPLEDRLEKVKRLDSVTGLGDHTVLIRKDSAELSISDSGAPIRDQDGKITGLVLVFRDVTVERRTQKALIASEKLAVAGRLAASIAHEIHNPLDSVSNMLYLMSSGSTDEENAQFVIMAQKEIARVTQISRSMLSLYRESTAPIPVNIREILEGTLVLLDHRVQDLQSTVSLLAPPDLTVQGFPAELRQVFTNLVINAVEAAGTNGHVSVSAKHMSPADSPTEAASSERYEDGVLVEITDDGPGIPQHAEERLFQPFFSTKGEQGTGLGLWVSRGIIRKHGGVIKLDSRTDTRGAVASVFLATQPVISPGAD